MGNHEWTNAVGLDAQLLLLNVRGVDARICPATLWLVNATVRTLGSPVPEALGDLEDGPLLVVRVAYQLLEAPAGASILAWEIVKT